MKLLITLTVALFVWIYGAQAQTSAKRDSLLKELKTLPPDTNRVYKLNSLGFQYHLNKPDTTYLLAQQAYELAHNLNYLKGEYISLYTMAIASEHLGYYAKSLKQFNQAKEGFQSIKIAYWTVTTLNSIANVYADQNKWQKALVAYQKVYSEYKRIPTPPVVFHAHILLNIGESYYNLKQLDSADYYFNLALPLAKKHTPDRLWAVYYDLGDVTLAKNNIDQARSYYQKSIAAARNDNSYSSLYEVYYRMTILYQKTAQSDSALYYAKLALNYGQKSENLAGILKASQFLTSFYEGHNDTQALRYYKMAVAAKDSLYSQDRVKQLLAISFEEKEKAQQIEVARVAYKNTIRFYVLIGILILVGAIALFLLQNNRQKQKANTLLQSQRDEINEQRSRIQQSLEKLKSTQTQLIQKEKMASLGELTAGIAHEIQNPLNFVNNFSQISTDLVGELESEVAAGNTDEVSYLVNALRQNLQKITHHGGRASAIVGGMLEHAKTSTGERLLTKLNTLAAEYLNLAYQGLRAKEKEGAPVRFTCELVTDFDPDLRPVEVVPQEISRVLLNLFNNAFYAVHEKQKKAPADYQPTVTVITRQLMDGIELRVEDNGTGIPETVKAKIFQPFFTTKPTGEGTGLGLSLSYDIVTKGHGGTLTVESQAREGTVLVIQLPLANASS